MFKRIVALASSIALASSLVVFTGSAATAATTEDDTGASSVGMYAVEIDESVANANGFEVVTNADGSKMSVPVSPEAIALYEDLGLHPEDRKVYPDSAEKLSEAIATESGDFRPLDTDVKTGWCGSSSITGEKGGGNVLYVSTGFDVILPTTRGTWTVFGTALLAGGMNQTWNVGTTTGVWQRNTDSIAFGPGVVGVTAASNVTLSNGDICYSLAPSVPFD